MIFLLLIPDSLKAIYLRAYQGPRFLMSLKIVRTQTVGEGAGRRVDFDYFFFKNSRVLLQMKPKHQTHSANLKRTKAKRAPGKGREHKKASHRVANSLAVGVYLRQHKCLQSHLCPERSGHQHETAVTATMAGGTEEPLSEARSLVYHSGDLIWPVPHWPVYRPPKKRSPEAHTGWRTPFRIPPQSV